MPTLILIHRVDRYEAATLAMFLIGIAMIIVSQVGEHLGWWNDLGEWGTAFGAILSVASIAIALLLGATKSEVRVVGDAVKFVGSEVHLVRDEVRQANTKLDHANTKLDLANTKLDQTNTQLEETNGTLHHIVRLLTGIRDRLAG